jgi:hypothetical protein
MEKWLVVATMRQMRKVRSAMDSLRETALVRRVNLPGLCRRKTCVILIALQLRTITLAPIGEYVVYSSPSDFSPWA